MDEDRHEEEGPAIHPAIPIGVGILAIVALVGALAYIIFFGGDSTRTAAPAPPPAPAPAPQAPAPAPAPPAPAPAPAPPAPAPPPPAPTPDPATARLTLTTPGGIAWTRRIVPLEIRASRGALRVRLEFRKNEHYDWSPIPAGRLSTQSGAAVDLPFSLARGTSAQVRWDLPSTTSRDDGVSPENSMDDDFDVVSIRAVARSGAGWRIVSAPITAVLVTKAAQTDVRATQIHVGVVFSGSAPIHLQWYEPKLWMSLPGGRTEATPIAGYAVDLVDRADVDAGKLPPPRIATKERSYDVPVPPASDREHVILVRPIDVAGNVAEPHLDVQFRSQNLVLLWPSFYDKFKADDPVPLKALTANSRPVCFESSPGDDPYENDRKWTPLPPGEVLRPSGKPVAAWPIRIARTGSRFVWTGLQHARKNHGRLQIRLVSVRVASGCGGVVAATGRKPLMWEP